MLLTFVSGIIAALMACGIGIPARTLLSEERK